MRSSFKTFLILFFRLGLLEPPHCISCLWGKINPVELDLLQSGTSNFVRIQNMSSFYSMWTQNWHMAQIYAIIKKIRNVYPIFLRLGQKNWVKIVDFFIIAFFRAMFNFGSTCCNGWHYLCIQVRTPVQAFQNFCFFLQIPRRFYNKNPQNFGRHP